MRPNLFLGTCALVLLCLLFPLPVSALPEVDARAADDNELDLSGEWGYTWGQFIPLDEFSNGDPNLETVRLPAYFYDYVQDRVDGIIQGYGTYAIRVTHLSSVFKRPSLYLKNARDAWQIWWIEDGLDPVLLGENGKVGKSKASQKNGHRNGFVDLPNKSIAGTLVVYASTYHVERSSLGHSLKISEHDSVVLSIVWGAVLKVLTLGIGAFIAIQNLVFYSRRRSEPALLMLSIFAVAIIVRSTLASPYIDLFLYSLNVQHITLRLEYLAMIWGSLALAHFVMALFPIPYANRYVIFGYTVFGIVVVTTFNIPVSTMTLSLSIYHIILLLFTLFALALLVRAMFKKSRGVRGLLLSAIPILIALIHDIAATRIAGYSLHIIEYAIILFLFLQTQIQLSRFVRALDISEHLTENLQYEIDVKTKELFNRNQELEKHTLSLRLQNQHVKLLSEMDHLTGLYNRQTLEVRSEEMFKQAISYGLPLSVAMMDLDHFKSINDQYGHGVGDECLIHAASYLRAYQFRKRDLIARYGGEEFIIILSDIPLLEAEKIINRVCKGLSEGLVHGDHDDIQLTSSFGIADIEICQASSIDELISAADEALYQAKENGRNRVEIYQPNLPAQD